MVQSVISSVMLLLAVVSMPAVVLCCSIAGVTVEKAASAAKPPETSAYKIDDVKAHIYNMGPMKMVENTRTPFSCVDARGDDSYLSTPGGDYAELSDAMYVFFEQTGVKPNASNVDYMFRTFMSKVASPQRPFYFHTDEGKLADMFRALGAAGIKPKPVIFPAKQPSDPKVAALWYDYLAKAEYQGCGHVRLMLYKYKDYGLTSPFVPQQLIKSFFKYWWPTNDNSAERQRIVFSVKRGPLAGKAVAIINNAGPSCQDKTPLARAAAGGSSMFVYHQAAVSQFRAKVLAPLFADLAKTNYFTGKPLKFDIAAFTKRLDQLAGAQLGYTVANLYPADHVNLFAVNVKTKAQ